MGSDQSRLSEKAAIRLELESKHLIRPEEAKSLYEGFVVSSLALHLITLPNTFLIS